ncbi:helix-turn-helix domain-containing protein [Bosea sp. 2KB_26]|uniref:helix-turn-helix domain-containing protein n=1 Tax=Bosea sp. 2KB_26 TaxID=3237475 RepID=UPI003F8E319D
MLRSIQQLRDTSAVGALLADGQEQLTLMGGGSEYRMPWHWHDCLMIFLPHVGAVDFRDETRQSGAWLSEDRFVVVPPGLAHQTSAARPVHHHVAIYAADGQLARIEARIGSLNRVRGKLGRTGVFAMTSEIRSLRGLCQSGHADDRVAQVTRSHLAAALLINCLAQIERSDELSGARPEGHGEMLVSEIKSFISQNASKDLPLDLVADRFGLSRRHATRLFRDKTGFSIATFQDHVRIRQAQELLVETTLPIGEIAWRVGFESGSALARAMKRLTGLTPTTARRDLARSDKP